ncbi:Hpt domain-containing protein [Mesorhizobium sp. SP-1A]|uniref:Hpt domain-containing protein n=1 Tax=Mesorhizobium sp. SP-1A TaxID=3077840 RepID=UPI0028F74EF3|nr:Hpt domain-containing protein [Mesorhizobium sp. SP-1A]
MHDEDDAAFSINGAEKCGSASPRPLDLEHLARQTMDDRDLAREVLELFVQQAISVRDSMAGCDARQRLLLAHNLKGAARGVGAFAIAEWAARAEENPHDEGHLDRLGLLIGQLRDFIATIDR